MIFRIIALISGIILGIISTVLITISLNLNSVVIIKLVNVPHSYWILLILGIITAFLSVGLILLHYTCRCEITFTGDDDDVNNKPPTNFNNPLIIDKNKWETTM
jgi:hypothetical protein